MTYIPDYLKTYPNMHSSFPLHISLNSLTNGYRAHRHDFLEFSYVVDGQGSESINDHTHAMTAGTFTFVQPYQVHELFTKPGSTLLLFNCNFSMDLIMDTGLSNGLMSLLDENDSSPFVQLEGTDNERMHQLLIDMYKEYEGDDRWKNTMLEVGLKEILVFFDRARRRSLPSADRIGQQRLKRNTIWPMIQYIHQNYQEDIALSDLAYRYSMSVSRTSELIKQTTGQTFVHFLHDLRIRHACSLLVSTQMNVSEIALEVGYGSYKTFSRVFRETKGVVPKDYRKLKAASSAEET